MKSSRAFEFQARRPVARGRRRSGSVLIEFGLISLVLYILLAGTIEMGRLLFAAQIVQDAARVAGREMALVPLPADMDFDTALGTGLVKERVFNSDLLVIDLDFFVDDEEREAFMSRLPPVNQALRPAMIFDRVMIGGTERHLLRYPGALLTNPNVPIGHVSGGFTVGIPEVVSRTEEGVETIRWLPVLEEIRPDPYDPSTGRFSLVPGELRSGVVALRFNYPFQSTSLSGFMNAGGEIGDLNLGSPIHARDSQVVQINDPALGDLLPIGSGSGAYSGPYGLGRQYALLDTVRPFRKLLSAQAIFRREVFQ